MIALVFAAGGDGGHGPPVFHTVPWAPFIEKRGGQMPGAVYQSMMRLHRHFSAGGGWAAFRGLTDTQFFSLIMEAPGIDLVSAAGMMLSRKMLLALGVLGYVVD